MRLTTKKNRKGIPVVWTEMAKGDLEDVVGYIAASDSVAVANRVLDKIRKFATTLTIFPDRGRVVPELKSCGILTYRELIMAPWRLLYRVEPDRVYVMSLVDSRRDVETLLFNRFLRHTPDEDGVKS